MTLDATARKTAKRLINKYGKSLTYTKVTDGTYSPTTGTATPTTSAKTVKAVPDVYKGDTFASDLIIAGDKKLIISALAFEEKFGASAKPKPGDKITFDTVVFNVVESIPTYSGELAAIYEVAARK